VLHVPHSYMAPHSDMHLTQWIIGTTARPDRLDRRPERIEFQFVWGVVMPAGWYVFGLLIDYVKYLQCGGCQEAAWQCRQSFLNRLGIASKCTLVSVDGL
jgi:hypothetical protein